MKCVQVALFALVLSSVCPSAAAVGSPIHQVVTLLAELKGKIQSDGKSQQQSFDKMACWCERTLDEKAAAIAAAKKQIEVLVALILRLSGEIGVHSAEVSNNLTPNIKADLEAQAVGAAMREKESAAFEADKGEAEQCLGALEAAINALSGKTGFLQIGQGARLESVASGITGVLQSAALSESLRAAVSADNLQIIRQFADSPQEFLRPQGGAQGGAFAAVQVAGNPFGDYAPRSGQVQGILKDMYDQFAMKLEKAGGVEADQQKSYEKFVAMKKQEVEALEVAKMTETKAGADQTKQRAEARTELDAVRDQLKADGKVFAEVKDACREKAVEWAETCRLRAGEIQGINKGMEILSSPEAKKIFHAASTTLLELSARSRSLGGVVSRSRDDVYERLRSLASRYGNLRLAQLAVQMKTGGRFEQVIVLIDKMLKALRQEGQDDIEHRDRCQAAISKNEADFQDAQEEIEDAEEMLQVLANRQTEAGQELNALVSEIEEAKEALKDRLELRNDERAAFKQAMKDDTMAVEAIGLAVQALADFYKRNKISLLLQQSPQQGGGKDYTVDSSAMPETSFGGEYKSGSVGTGNIISILTVISEDFENEIKTGRADDAKAQKRYLEDVRAMRSMLKAQAESKLALEKALTEMDGRIAGLTTLLGLKEKDLGQLDKMHTALHDDCAWVETHFDSRRDQRQHEIDGLAEARAILGAAPEP